MSLNATTLGTEILDAITAAATSLYPQSVAGLTPYHTMLADSIAAAVVAHITANAVVQPGTFNIALVGVGGTGTIT